MDDAENGCCDPYDRETKQGVPHPIRHMRAAAQLKRAKSDCEEKLDPNARLEKLPFMNAFSENRD